MTIVDLQTSLGSIKIELDEARAPKTVANFLSYVDSGHYDGTLFHRVIDGFMAQGGGYDTSFTKKPTQPPIENEADNGRRNTRGTVAMARTSDPHSATAQFFINVSDNAFLDHKDKSERGWGYAVFGKIIGGMRTVDKIRGVKTGAKAGFRKDAPLEDIVILSAKRA